MNKENKIDEVSVQSVEDIIKQRIFIIRGHKVMLDRDLAEIYQVPTKSLNLAVRRNVSRFPNDFMFKVTEDDYSSLRFQFETSKIGRGGTRYLPYVFTEHGVAMLSSVLNSERAIQMNILIIRVFIKIKELILSNKDLEIRVGEVEKKQKEQGDILANVHEVVRQLVEEPVKPKGKIGFQTK